MKIVGDLILQRFLFVFCACVFNLVFGASLYHYQDYDNKEIDAVVELKNGDWCAFEIKLGANQIDFAAESLLKINKKLKQILRANRLKPYALFAVCQMLLTNALTECMLSR